MKRYRQFRILHVALLTLAVAIVIAWTRDFEPKVTYLDASPGMQRAVNGKTYPCVRFTFRNDGYFPIWYARSSPDSCSMHILQYPAGETANDVWIMPDAENRWIRINPGANATVSVPFDSGAMVMRIAVEFTDWRGRRADCWSDIVNPTAVAGSAALTSPPAARP